MMNSAILALALMIPGPPPIVADTLTTVGPNGVLTVETELSTYTIIGLRTLDKGPKRYRDLHTELCACMGVLGDYENIVWRIALAGSRETKVDTVLANGKELKAGDKISLWGLVSIVPGSDPSRPAYNDEADHETSFAVVTLFGIPGQRDSVIKHEMIHWLLWRYTGDSDGNHTSMWWELCEGKELPSKGVAGSSRVGPPF
jgi:hypothetical protein